MPTPSRESSMTWESSCYTEPTMDTTTIEQARAAKAEALEIVGPLARVVGIGITRVNGHFGLKVNLEEASEVQKLPTRVGGVPVRIEIVGEIEEL